MSGYPVAVVLCAAVVILLIFLLRTRRIREKFAHLVGVQTPVNLLFAIGFAVLLAVCIQLSSEVSNLEEETRTLAEELALLTLEVRTGQPARIAPPNNSSTD
jgi:hypothetical protein